ncbi:MAG: cyclic nucleotide-binding domain-containing protein [Pseudomonadota bacterium]
MSVRWEIIIEKFAPGGMIDDDKIYGQPADVPHLRGDVVLDQVTVRDGDGNPVLEDISVTLPQGAIVGITATNDEDRRALAEVLTRETLPTSGTVTLAGHDIRDLHQAVIAKRVGHATSRPIMFQGSFGDNVLMPVRFAPRSKAETAEDMREAARTGNSMDALAADWLDPSIAGLTSADDLRAWWADLIEGIGSRDALIRRAMDQSFDAADHPQLGAALIALRPKVADALARAGLDRHVHRFDFEKYNPALPATDNLLFATPMVQITPEVLTDKVGFLRALQDMGLGNDLERLTREMIEMLRQIFGATGTDHPLFRRVGLDAAVYEAALDLVTRKQKRSDMTDEELALLFTIPAKITAEQVGPSFPVGVAGQILAMRRDHGETLRAQMADLYAPITPDGHLAGLSVLENVLYGKVSDNAGNKAEDLRHIVADVLMAEGITPLVLELIFDIPITLGGANLPSLFAEPLSVSRATIKRPDILILEQVMDSFDATAREALFANLRKLLPDTTLIYLYDAFDDDSIFDLHFEVEQGRLVGAEGVRAEADSEVGADLARKLDALSRTPMFAGLKRKQLRLLAFGARWYAAAPGEYVFHKNDDPTDGAYMVIDGEADLILPGENGDETLIATVGPGALVGELGLIRREPRALDMRAKTQLNCLRIGEEEFMAVVENDAATAFRLLQVVAGYVNT